MKALVLKNKSRLELEEVPTPMIGPEEVLIEVGACGICGSDIHGMYGSTGRRKPPIIMGHEASGTIVETGTDVDGFKRGDRVTFDSTIYCGKCDYCKSEQVNLCDNRRVVGVSCDDYRQQGAFAEYVVVPQRILYTLPPNVEFEQAAMIEVTSVALHAVQRCHPSSQDTTVVVGTGIVGLLIIQLLRAAKCENIIAVEPNQQRLDMALRLGASDVLNPKTHDIREEILIRTGGRGTDFAFEVAGIRSSFSTCISCIKKGGTITLVGNLERNVDFPLQQVVTGEISLLGSCASSGEYPDCIKMIANGQIDVDSLISATAPLEEGSTWFRRLYNKEPGLMKVILMP